MITNRVFSQASSWIPSLPYVFVYSDEFPNESIKQINNQFPHANISFVEIKNRSEHIIGSQWTNPWYRAQPRFLPAMHDLWKQNPHVRWYIVCDDDTYLYNQNILRRLGKHNSSNPEVISFFWCTWNYITEYMKPERDCHPFAQGGSGVIFSKTMMDLIGPKLIECSEKYNDAEHAASMRVSVCMEREFGYENWTKGGFIKPWKSGIHPSNPSVVISQGNTWDSPGSFHQVSPEEMVNLKKSHLVWLDDGFIDFSYFAFRSVPVELTRRRWWQLHFGYRIDNFASHSNQLMVLTSFEPIEYGKNNEIKTFQQVYQGNVTVFVHCNNNYEDFQIDVDEVERGPATKIHVSLKCPKKQKYYK
ncbi:hypothetical protein TRFO_30992 [Tritrichomonas foetus]|uniref:N-acetylgalactosaminide beta-1,3-galactosyltransferase n=1 Tax=Tritrichomonas foetus TaxID=1144522 RepID=A0A1J4JXM5_9EUKA|nr:hypothetical protein TRFO_30992 [Tritrichomonas foetus]|eukprot:OHT02029.1 hypothetical protein TRFO_30992 [Tritrichomonas foetus]